MGKVYIVGAGPGDPKLLTIKAKELLEDADVVVYDHLINRSILDLCKERAELIYVGKEAGKHTLSQEKINELLLKMAKEGKKVIRLKGGDPYIFGRGGEEAEVLADEGVEFEVVPGISAAVAVSSYAGIPLTHRKFSSSVIFLTGHEDPTKKSSFIDWDLLAKFKGTLVFFMGVKNLEQICHTLIEKGMDEKRPASLIMWGTTCRHRSISASLKDMPDLAKAKGFSPPSLLIIGEVVRLKDKLNWFERLPLLGKGIVITRARKQASVLKSELESYGACCFEFPTIKIVPVKDYSRLHKAIDNISKYDWIIFTSANGVEFFFSELEKKGKDARHLNNIKVASIGPATSDKLRSKGIIPDFMPDVYVAEEVAYGLTKFDLKGKKILIPRAKKAREVLIELLEKNGAKVEVLPVYETVLEDGKKDEFIDLLEAGLIHMITFTSSSTVKNFFKIIDPKILKNKDIAFASIGPITASTLKEFGFDSIVAKKYTIKGLVDVIKEYFLRCHCQ